METPPVYDLYVPEHHKEMVAKIYDFLEVRHNLTAPKTLVAPSEPESVILTGVNELEGCAEIFISAYGENVVKEVRKLLRGFCVEHISTINLFLKLSDPLTFSMTAEFEKMGFFFAGLLPESRIGDTLALQFLNNVELDYHKIILVSDMAKELLVYIEAHDPNLID
jgi:serine/threonine-protein kinase RsbW